MKYRKKPIVIEAEQYTDPMVPVKGMCIGLMCPTIPHVHTIHNNQFTPVELGDFIIPEPDNEHCYPCKADIFVNTYESVDNLPDAEDEQLEAKINERRSNCECPVCGDPEFHAEGCEIGQLQAETEQLKQCIKEQSSLIAPGADEIWQAMDRLYCDFHSVRNDYTEALENLLAAWDRMLG